MSRLIVAIETHRNRGIGTFLRCAVAFGASTVIIVGSTQFGTHGAHGAQLYVQIIHYYTWDECIKALQEEGCTRFVGISPHVLTNSNDSSSSGDSLSKSIDTMVFNDTSCFVIGASIDGLSPEMVTKCDEVTHIEVPLMEHCSFIKYDSKIALCFQKFCIDTASVSIGSANEKHELGARNKMLVKFCSKQKKEKNEGCYIDDMIGGELSSMFNEDGEDD